MLDLLVKSAVRRKIVGLFALNSKEEFYSRQVAHEIVESPHAVHLELGYLSKNGLLETVNKGSRIFYRWNKNYPYADILKSVIEKMRERSDKEMATLPDLEQRRRLETNLKRVLQDIRKYYDPEKVILFGSAASGKTGPHSDLDIVIIKETDLPYFKRIQQLVDLLDYDVGIDFFIYTPDEFKQAATQKRFFKDEILKKGEVLYEKAA